VDLRENCAKLGKMNPELRISVTFYPRKRSEILKKRKFSILKTLMSFKGKSRRF
jgi:hypothetical protein